MEATDFLRLFDYDAWANRECITAMRLENIILLPDVIGRIAHILSAQRLWLERILGQSPTLPVWPTSTLQECGVLAEEMTSAWRSFLIQISTQTIGALSQRSLQDNVKYRNTKGEPFFSQVEGILTHVLFHSAYHRGQVALQLRSSGAMPAYTDFIHAVREGFVD